MARGWESKSVEAQIDDAEKRRAAVQPKVSEAELKRRSELEELELQRRRVMHDMEATRNPRYRQSLEAGLAYLEAKIQNLL
jgi:hypothetical protein